MSAQSQIADAHRAQRVEIGNVLIGRVRSLWSQASVNTLDGSWDALAPSMVAQVVKAQTASAALATPYMNGIDRSYGRTTPDVQLAPESFAGVTLDGREVGPAMYTAVTTAKTAIGRGMAPAMAFQVGANALAVVVSAALQDMGRQADFTLGRARTYTKYVRVVGGSACSRCAILAGIWSAETAFLRHVSCQCTAAPVQVDRVTGKEKVPSGFHASPEAYFESLSKADQDRVFTKAGAEAIRQGASPVKVVNARRGAYGIGYNSHYYTPTPHSGRRLMAKTIGRKPDGSPLKVFMTGEGTTARGEFGRSEIARSDGLRRTTTIRLMPEQLMHMAGGDTERFRDLIKRYGYAY